MRNKGLNKLKRTGSYQSLIDKINSYKPDINLRDKVVEGSKHSSTAISTAQQFFLVISAALSTAGRNVPYAGGIIGLLAIIPKALATILDKEKSFKEKAMSSALLTILTGLIITALVLGSTAALIIGAVTAGLVTAFEVVGLAGKISQKNALTSEYKLHQRFEEAIANRNIALDNNEFDELIALSYTQSLYKQRNGKIANENFTYLEKVKEKKGLKIHEFPSAQALNLLYDKKDQLVNSIRTKFQELEEHPSSEDEQRILRDIHIIKKDLYQNKVEIDAYTKNSKRLGSEVSKLNDKIAISKASASIGSLGFLLSVATVLLITGVFAAPPVAISVVLGLSIAVAVAGLLKFAAEKYVEYDHKKMEKAKQLHDETKVLDNALALYDAEKMQKEINRALEVRSSPIDIPSRENSPARQVSKESTSSLIDDEMSDNRATVAPKPVLEPVEDEEGERESEGEHEGEDIFHFEP